MGLVVTQRQTASFQLAFLFLFQNAKVICVTILLSLFYYLPWNYYYYFFFFSKKYFKLKKKINSTIGFAGWVLLVGELLKEDGLPCVWSHRESSAFWGAGAWNDQLYKTSREREEQKARRPRKKNDVCCTFPWKHQHVRISDIVIITERFFSYIFFPLFSALI